MGDPRRGALQTAYQIQVATSPALLDSGTPDMWDSTKVGSNSSVAIAYDGKPLVSRTRYYWRVRLWDDQSRSAGKFGEAGVVRDGAARSQGLARTVCAAANRLRHGGPILRREFIVSKPISRARAYVTGLGYCEFYLNGRRVGNRVLDPPRTDFAKRVCYSTYDIKDYLAQGRNCAGAMLGRGWWGENPRFLLQLEIEYTDGSKDTVVSDGAWKWAEGPIRENSLYSGETFDARLEPRWLGQARLRRFHVAAGRADRRARCHVERGGHPADRGRRDACREIDHVAQAGRLGGRFRAEYLRLVPAEGGCARWDTRHAQTRRASSPGRDGQPGEPALRQGDGHVYHPRGRHGDLRAAVHLSRLPLRADRGLPGHPQAERDRGASRLHRAALARDVRVLEQASQPGPAQRLVDRAYQLPLHPDRLPPARRAPGLDGGRVAQLACDVLQLRYVRRLHQVPARHRRFPARGRGRPRYDPARLGQPARRSDVVGGVSDAAVGDVSPHRRQASSRRALRRREALGRCPEARGQGLHRYAQLLRRLDRGRGDPQGSDLHRHVLLAFGRDC